jgi:hypothetical protein
MVLRYLREYLREKRTNDLDKKRIPPAVSAILIKPMNRAMIPINPIQRFTASLQVSNIPFAGNNL